MPTIRRLLVVPLVLLAAVLTGCASSAIGKPSATGIGTSLTAGDFTVTVNSVVPYLHEIQSGDEENNPVYEEHSYELHFAATYNGTEPTTDRLIPYLDQDTHFVGKQPAYFDDPVPLQPGATAEKISYINVDLTKKSHRFYLLQVNSSGVLEVIGTLTLGPGDLK